MRTRTTTTGTIFMAGELGLGAATAFADMATLLELKYHEKLVGAPSPATS